MLVREHRKISEVGSSPSFVMRLPKAWATAVGLTRESEVLVAFGEGDILFVAAPGSEAEIERLLKAAGGKP